MAGAWRIHFVGTGGELQRELHEYQVKSPSGPPPCHRRTRNTNATSGAADAASNWPAAWQIAPDVDWTGYRQSAAGSNQAGTVFMAAMGNPLEPGDYVVGVTTGTSGPAPNPMSYTLVSRVIGTNYSIPI